MSTVYLEVFLMTKLFEPEHDKTNKMTYVPSEDSDQLGIYPVWSVFAVGMKKMHSEDWSELALSENQDQPVHDLPRSACAWSTKISLGMIWVFRGLISHFVDLKFVVLQLNFLLQL